MGMATITRRTSVPYEIQQQSGTILDILKNYVDVCANEFCGKCMPCRYGTKEWSYIIQKLIDGEGSSQDIQKIKTINHSMKMASFCRLGLVSPFVIDSILKYHQEELENFVSKKTPLPNNITTLPKFIINNELCNGCPDEEKAMCKQVCSVNAIDGEQGSIHNINQVKCFRCDECVSVCPQKAIAFL